jgi:hypothetical protein
MTGKGTDWPYSNDYRLVVFLLVTSNFSYLIGLDIVIVFINQAMITQRWRWALLLDSSLKIPSITSFKVDIKLTMGVK